MAAWGCYLRGLGAWTLSTGDTINKSVNGWNLCHILACFSPMYIIIMLKMYRERTERKLIEKICVWGIKKHRSAAVRGAPPGPASVLHLKMTQERRQYCVCRKNIYSHRCFVWLLDAVTVGVSFRLPLLPTVLLHCRFLYIGVLPTIKI